MLQHIRNIYIIIYNTISYTIIILPTFQSLRERKEKIAKEKRLKDEAERKAKEEVERKEKERIEEEERKARLAIENKKKAKAWAEQSSKLLLEETENDGNGETTSTISKLYSKSTLIYIFY